jgi:integrase
MTKRLTAIGVAHAKPKIGKDGKLARNEIPDGGSGLYQIVQSSQCMSWASRYRLNGETSKLTLGRVAVKQGDAGLTLAAARKANAEVQEKVAQGINPAAEKKREKAASKEAQARLRADTIEHWVAEFIRLHVKVKNKSWRQGVWLFERHVLPAWKDRTIHDITRREVNALLREIAHGDPPRPILANRVLSAVGKLFSWLTAEDVINVSPAKGVAQPGRENRRERVLSALETAAVWHGSEKLGEPYEQFVKLLLLTGQRRTEVSGMRWSELDLGKGIWALPSERTKNGRQHTIMLSRQALDILGSITPIEGPFVFTTTGENHIKNYSRIKMALDRHVKLDEAFTLHDLRRTCATGMADIGVAPHIIEAVINHISGHRAGVAGIYNRSQYGPQVAEASQRWADRIEQLVQPGQPGKVVPLHGRR